MNFFETQDQARQNTQRLLLLFVLMVAVMIAALYLTIVWVRHIALVMMFQRSGLSWGPIWSWWHPHLFLGVAFITLLVISWGSLSKFQDLKLGGGKIVAIALGGELVRAETADSDRQQLLNVVEEMAIAAGIPVPAVYVLEQETGINAFAAGHTINDAVIGLTRGSLEQLTRDELQGVIGHEFSHILNGDMSLNFRLMGILHGMLIVYFLGRGLLQAGARRRGGAYLAIAGVGIIAVGSLGLLCGRLLKSAVSRQREFLADASAVQFTRNTEGLVGALRKISGYKYNGSQLLSSQAEAASHMFFSNALGAFSRGNLMATHPPVTERLKRLGAARGTVKRRSKAGTSHGAEAEKAATLGLAPTGPTSPSLRRQRVADPDHLVQQVGSTSPEHLDYAQALLAKLPSELRQGVKQREGAVAIVYALLLDPDPVLRQQQLQSLSAAESSELIETITQFNELITQLDPRCRLPLLDLTIPALRTSSETEFTQFCQDLDQLIKADDHLSLSEYVLEVILERRLKPPFQ